MIACIGWDMDAAMYACMTDVNVAMSQGSRLGFT
jgi:hypothetical protein